MKSRTYKLVVVALGTVVLVAVILNTVAIVHRNNEQQRAAEQARLQQEAIMDSYVKVNFAFHITFTSPYTTGYRERLGVYRPLEISEDQNRFGVYYDLYLTLKYYEKMTGVTISYQAAVDYLSEEYEPDGSLRLYNNGLHPEVEVFVDWMWQQREDQYETMDVSEMYAIAPGHQASGALVELEAYIESMRSHYHYYYGVHRDEGFVLESFSELSPQMYDELVRKEADPDYEMDLLSLQQQGY
jgi:hypothetical protein